MYPVIFGGIISGLNNDTPTALPIKAIKIKNIKKQPEPLFFFLRLGGWKSCCGSTAIKPGFFSSTGSWCLSSSGGGVTSKSSGGGVTVYLPVRRCVFDFEPSKAFLNSSADWKRSAGSTAIARSIALARRREILLLRLRSGVKCAFSMARAKPSSGITPHRDAYSVAPREYTSVRASVRAVPYCSGGE